LFRCTPSPFHKSVEGVYGDQEASVYAFTLLTGIEEAAAHITLHRAARYIENLRRLFRRGPPRCPGVLA
jgi:hypothetical protein